MLRYYISTFLISASPMFAQKISYPQTAKVNQIDEYFGVKVADPYRWLEVSDSVAVREWIKAQNTLTFDYLSQIPYRSQIRKRLQEVWNYPKMGVPVSYGDFEIIQKKMMVCKISLSFTSKKAIRKNCF